VAPGTGLGAAFTCPAGKHSAVQATEAGHLSFAPRADIEMQLFSFLKQQHEHVSFEMVCSGMGLENIFSFLEASGVPVAEDLAIQRRKGHALAPLLSERALDEELDCLISRRTYELFFDILAEFCGNLAMALVPGAGIYLGGGMLSWLLPLLDAQRFASRMDNRGKMQSLAAAIPVFLINHPRPALLGAYRIGRRTFYDEK
jgi:glucokinase